MKKSREELKKELAKATAKLEQYQHRGKWLSLHGLRQRRNASAAEGGVNIGAQGEMWHHKLMLWAQAQGLQGHKRLNRYESAHDRAQYIRIQNYAVDMFGAIIVSDWDYCKW